MLSEQHRSDKIETLQKVPQSLLDNLNYDTKPNSCIVLQILHSVWFGQFTSKIYALPNHRIYRKDKVFLYPTIEHVTRLKIMENGQAKSFENFSSYNDTVRLSYYYGRFLDNTSEVCAGEMTKSISPNCKGKLCQELMRNITVVFSLDCKIQILLSEATQPYYFAADLIELPMDHLDANVFSTFDLRSFSETYAWTRGSASWLTSTIYHINCSQSTWAIAAWSQLSHTVIDETCM